VLIGRELYAAIQAKDWAAILGAAGKLATAAAEFFKKPVVMATAADATADADLDALLGDLKACCAEPVTLTTAEAADPKFIDPATLAIILQFAMMIFEAIRKRRAPTPPAQ
jgi:hypothetical protein